jgi:hypothetical protein
MRQALKLSLRVQIGLLAALFVTAAHAAATAAALDGPAGAGFVILGFAAYCYLAAAVSGSDRALREQADAAALEARRERDAMAALREHLAAGFFFMDRRLVIQSRHSRSLERILGTREVEGKSLVDLLEGRVPERKLRLLAEHLLPLAKTAATFHRLRLSMGETESLLRDRIVEEGVSMQELCYVSPETGEEKILKRSFAPVLRGEGLLLGSIEDVTAAASLRARLAEEPRQSREEAFRLEGSLQDPGEKPFERKA